MGEQKDRTVPGGKPAGKAEFVGDVGALVRVLLRNALLTVVTLGIYRFWAKTRLRRYFWNGAEVAGDRLEYTGTGKELFLGFLIVLAVLTPIGAAYGFLEQAIGVPGDPAWVATNLVYYIVIFLLIQVGLYRMWRYRLTRTAWRGIRFDLDGATWPYVWRAALWSLAVVLSLGIAYPWMRAALTGYKLRRVRFGSLVAGFDMRGRMGGLVLPWLSLLVLGIAVGAAAVPVADPLKPVVAVAGVVGAMVIFVWYRVRELRAFTGAFSLDDLRLASAARTSSVLVAAVVSGLATLAVGGCLALGMAALFLSRDPMNSEEVVGILMTQSLFGFVLAIAFLISVQIIRQLTFVRPVVAHFCETLTIERPDVLERAVQSAGGIPKRGEGLADAFDVGAF